MSAGSMMSDRRLVIAVSVDDRDWMIDVPADLIDSANSLRATGSEEASEQLLKELQQITWYNPNTAIENLYRVRLKPRPPIALGKKDVLPPPETVVKPNRISLVLYKVDFEDSSKGITPITLIQSATKP